MKVRATILTLGPALVAAALMASGPAAIAEDIPQIKGVTVTGTRIATVERPAGGTEGQNRSPYFHVTAP